MVKSAQFELVAKLVKVLDTQPNELELLDLYGWYKQATIGDVNIPQPIGLDLIAKKKWHAWNKVKGALLYDSEVNYILIANTLINKYGLKKHFSIE
jgi:diazepam-binding inhibitor (GABA receptor modulating acyl-CoA-binding protein)